MSSLLVTLCAVGGAGAGLWKNAESSFACVEFMLPVRYLRGVICSFFKSSVKDVWRSSLALRVCWTYSGRRNLRARGFPDGHVKHTSVLQKWHCLGYTLSLTDSSVLHLPGIYASFPKGCGSLGLSSFSLEQLAACAHPTLLSSGWWACFVSRLRSVAFG